MFKIRFPMIVCAVALIAGLGMSIKPALAQTATEDTTQEQAPSVGDQLSLGEDASGEPQVGQPYTQEVIGAWEMRCIKTEEGDDPCQMYQLLDDGQEHPDCRVFAVPSARRRQGGGRCHG